MYYCESMPLTELRGMDRSPASGVDSSEGAADPASEVNSVVGAIMTSGGGGPRLPICC